MFNSVNTCWTLVAAFLVYFMQAGFALCEAGFTRAKNTGNILMKNMMDFCIGTPCYWLIGFGIMFGGTGALIGGFDPFIQGDYSHLGLDIPLWVYIVFQTVFCATAATIVSGSMAERTNFKAYCVYSAMISLVVYPICGHWMWGGGWLQSMGFHDFAGSAAVHNVGGIIAMLGAALLGPRIGKYDKDGKPHAIPGHNLTAGALGVFILWFCWFGFNGGSSLSLSTDETMTLTGLVCFNTNLAAAVATCVTMIFTWKRYGKPDVSMTLNGSLAGLVAITAGCDAVSPFGAFIIGFVAGILVVLSVEFFDNIAKIDDPVGAVSVHFVNGVWGTIAVGLFSNGGDGVGKGLFYGGGFAQLGTQLLGLITVDVYVVVVMFIIFKIIDKTIGLRVPAEVEIDGLDIHEHGLTSAYAGFSISDANAAAMGEAWLGSAKGVQNVVMVTIGTGVGGGVIVNGDVVSGVVGAGGEIGHMCLNPEEERTCGCGGHGHLEQYSSATGVVSNYLAECEKAGVGPIELTGPSDSKDVFQACREGDKLALAAADTMADYLGRALALIANVVDPEMFLIGGGASASADVYLDAVREHFQHYALSASRETPIEVASLGNDAGIIGAAYVALRAAGK